MLDFSVAPGVLSIADFTASIPLDEEGEQEFFALGRRKLAWYRILATIGEGAEGRIQLVESRLDGRKFAMKSFLPAFFALRSRVEARRDTKALGMKFPLVRNLPTPIDYFETETMVYTIWELMKCSLPQFVALNGGKLSEQVAARVLTGVLLALKALHGANIIHRDVKPDNLLLRDATDPTSVCLVDFGAVLINGRIAADAVFPELGRARSNPSLPVSEKVFSSLASSSCDIIQAEPVRARLAGTPNYLSPQIIAGERATAKDDIWAVGCVAYELLHGHLPFQVNGTLLDLWDAISKGQVRKDNVWVSPAAARFVSRLMDVNRDTRPSAEEALDDPWLSEMCGTELLNEQLINESNGGGDVDFYRVDSSVDSSLMVTDTPQQEQSPFSFVMTADPRFGVSGAHVYFDPVTHSLHVIDAMKPSM